MTLAALDRTSLDRGVPDRAGADNAADNGSVFVTLTVADQLCGIPVLAVRDILAEQAITRIPLASPEIAGSLNLRGRIVTAIDLRRRLRLADAPAGVPRMSVVTEQGGELYALLVDQVSEVMTLPGNAFDRNPPTLPPPWSAFSAGIFRLPGRLLVVLDVARLLALTPES
jgi:purine-binding chemotaxis protein CheW